MIRKIQIKYLDLMEIFLEVPKLDLTLENRKIFNKVYKIPKRYN